jgi:threonylcarbamoyladenosine tRNA methylthiotransferase MtaB
VVREVQAREADGVLEVVLTGTQLGNYGRDLGWPRSEQGPRALLAELLHRTSIPRIRLSSLQAQDISPELLQLWRDPRMCPHFHIPLQSGSDAVLGPMRRRYTADDYRTAIALIREMAPRVAITTDVIAGFPGETDADFEATYALCAEIGFAAMHCFPYSRRPHTGADRMNGHLPPPVKRGRLERLLALAERSSGAWRRAHIGREMPVLWERRSDGYWEGLTGNYLRVYATADADLENRLVPARLTALHADGMLGELVPADAQ